MAAIAQKFQVVEAECDRWIRHVVRRDPDLVMHLRSWLNQSALQAPFTQTANLLLVRCFAFAPCISVVKAVRKAVMHQYHHKQNPAFYISWVSVCLSHTAISLSCVVASDRTCTDAIVTANCTQMHRTVRANHRPKDGRERRAALHRPLDIDRERDEPGVEVYPQNLTLSLYADRV